jgi:hypothetical protein
VAVERPRIASSLMLAGAACTVVCALAGTYMAGGLRTRIVHDEAPSELTVAYLEAWLRGAPTDPDYLSALANQYLALGRCDEAQAAAARLSALGVQQSRRKAIQIELRCDELRAFAAPADSPRRAALLARVANRLDAAAQLDWDIDELEFLSRQALAVGAPRIAARYQQRLAEADPAHRVYWQRQAADRWLGSGDYRRAAAADFAAQASARNVDEARDAFIAGVRALQSGNLLDEALAQGQAHLDGLANDRRTLEVLLQLARAAQRPDLVDRYARALMKFVDSRSNERERTEGLRLAAVAGTPPGGVWLTLAPAGSTKPVARFGARSDVHFAAHFAEMPHAASPARIMPAVWNGARRAGLLRVADKVPARAWSDTGAAAAIAASQAASAKAEAEAAASAAAAARSAASTANSPASTDLAATLYQSFLESNDLENAAKVASEQVARHPDRPEWRKRLAQVEEWRNEPAAALQAWLAYARQTDDPAGWSNVQRIAPMLDDDASYVQALTHASDAAPDNLQLVDGVIAAYERLGRPDDALAFLQARMHGAQEEPMASRYALLSERAGYMRQALDTWQALQRSHPEKVEYAVHSANLLYRLGDYRGALDALKAVRAHATDHDTLYWRTYGQLARLLQSDADSNLAYRHLLAGGEATPEDLAGMTFFYERQPLDAARVAELQYDRGHDVTALRQAIDAYLSAHSLERAGALLRRLTPDQRRDAERDPAFLAARAEYERQSGALNAALADLRHAVALPGVGGDVRAAYLWMLVDAGSEADVRATLDRWRRRSLGDESLWGPFAAGEMRLNRPVAALRYLRLQAVSRQRDPLWLLTYADAQEMAGHLGIATAVRRHVWLDLLAAERRGKPPAGTGSDGRDAQPGNLLQRPARSDWESVSQLQGRRAALAQTQANGDEALRLLDSLTSPAQPDGPDESQHSLLGDTRGVSPLPDPAGARAEHLRVREAVARDVAVAWAISDERYSVAKRWLARRYAHRLLGTQDGRLAIALAEDDVQTMKHLLDERTAALPIYNRIDASMRVDRQGEAQARAFHGLDGAPDDTELHTRLVDATAFWNQSISASVEDHVEHPLDYVQQTLAANLKLSDHYMLGLHTQQRIQRSTDASQLVNLPSIDRSADLYARRLTHDSQVTLDVGRRYAADAFYTLRADATLGRNSPVSFTASVQRSGEVTELQTLTVGGVKDDISGGVTWQPTPRWSFTASIEADRFYSQARNFVGSGVLQQAELDYKIRTEYPDYTLRFTGAHGAYNDSGQPDALLQRLVPATLGPLSAADFMPNTFSQFGAFIGFGNDLADRYTHAWRPYLDIGMVHDTSQGWGLETDVGIAGSVFGGDHAAVYFQRERIAAAGTSLTLIGVRYRWLY